jgi:putative flippase GtrA
MTSPPGERRPLFTSSLKLARFLAAGFPAFLVAIPMNYVLVEWADLSKTIAYAIVLVFQVSINFFILRAFVFDASQASRPVHVQFLQFFSGIIGIRVVDWLFYVFLVEVAGVYFVLAQVINVVLFSILKYGFSQRVMEK